MSVNLNNFTSNVANGRALINEHYNAQIAKLDLYLEGLNSDPATDDATEKLAQLRQYAKVGQHQNLRLVASRLSKMINFDNEPRRFGRRPLMRSSACVTRT